jgi:Mn2+/Fe2+ NRAMP family transporter
MGKKIRRFLKILGPGVVTGAADDDPSGIATYSQAGAQFGPSVLWLNVVLLPFQAAVQEACARIGAVTGRGLAANVKRQYPKWVLYGVVILVLLANTINIGADIGAMAESLQLVAPFSFTGWMLIVTASILILEVFTSYQVYARILKWLSLALLVYPLTLLMVAHGAWGELWQATTHIAPVWSGAFWFIAIGVAGTTISPYMFFWQAGQEIEEEKAAHVWRLWKPRIGPAFIGHLRLDNMVGMVMSGVAAWAIMAVAALVLFPHGITNIQTAAQAAQAIEPLVAGFPNAGYLAKILFSFGVVSLGFLSIPVLSGSAAYAIAEAFHFREGLNKKLSEAHGFYGAITISTLFGLLINYLGIDPMKALVYTAVINGVVAVPLIFVIARLAANAKLMGKWKSGLLSQLLTYGTVILMGAGVVGMLVGMV